MKTSDGRFIEKRIKIPKELVKQIIYKIKEDGDLSWNELSNRLGVSSQTIRADWIIKGNTIPKSLFKRLLKMDKNLIFNSIKTKIEVLNPFWGQERGGRLSNRILNNSIKIPDVKTNKFAEFYGVMIGDGCIYSNLNGLCIAGNSISDRVYYESYLNKLILDLFGIEPKIYYSNQTNSVRCVLYSKRIAKFLEKYGFPIGKKNKHRLHIPPFIMGDKRLIALCLRGIMDSDGNICAHPNSKIMIQISITIPSLLISCKEAFSRLGIEVGIYNKGINIYGIEKIKKYFNLIGSSNPKHYVKYNLFLENKRFPSRKEIESFLKKEIHS